VQIQLARTNVPQAEFRCADATQVEFAPDTFDAVVSFYAIDHIPRQEHALLFQRIHRWLHRGGFLLADGEGRLPRGVGSDLLVRALSMAAGRVRHRHSRVRSSHVAESLRVV
jgi:SAM-dependent methyltransferase